MVNNVSRRYELHVSQGHRLFYWPGPNGKRGACKLHIGDDPFSLCLKIHNLAPYSPLSTKPKPKATSYMSFERSLRFPESIEES